MTDNDPNKGKSPEQRAATLRSGSSAESPLARSGAAPTASNADKVELERLKVELNANPSHLNAAQLAALKAKSPALRSKIAELEKKIKNAEA